MWYVLQCSAGREDELLRSCRRNITEDILKDVFFFTYDQMKRYCGSWHIETKRMFPDYVFLETDHADELSGELTPYKNMVRILKEKDKLLRICQEEEELLSCLCGSSHHLELSKGYIRDGITYVTEGPLKGMEPHIKRIDRHKRLASLKVPVRDAFVHGIKAGLEIMEKS